jgi:hypothetical protein
MPNGNGRATRRRSPPNGRRPDRRPRSGRRNQNLPYTWPEDELKLKRPERPYFRLLIALVMCIIFTIVYLTR